VHYWPGNRLPPILDRIPDQPYIMSGVVELCFGPITRKPRCATRISFGTNSPLHFYQWFTRCHNCSCVYQTASLADCERFQQNPNSPSQKNIFW